MNVQTPMNPAEELSETAGAEPEVRTLILASHRPERQKSGFDRANLVIWNIMLLAVHASLLRLRRGQPPALEPMYGGAVQGAEHGTPLSKPLKLAFRTSLGPNKPPAYKCI